MRRLYALETAFGSACSFPLGVIGCAAHDGRLYGEIYDGISSIRQNTGKALNEVWPSL